ncbi:MAG: helicase RepA family protein [Actinomycetota bacterium]|nr:helicase RepA family protein [Actinomycetota bacterium]
MTATEAPTARETHPLLSQLRTGAWLDQQNFPPLVWVVPGLIPEGMSLVIGGPKIGKSWLALGIGLAVAAGGKVLGSVSVGAPRPVLLLALEDGDRRLQERSRRLLADQPLPPLLNYMTRIEPGCAVTTIEAWLEQLDPDVQPLVILDTLGKVMPPTAPGESPYQRDYRVAGRLQQIAADRPGMALMALHHDRKAVTEDFVDSVSGTNGIAGAADTLIVMTRPRTEDRGLFKVTGRDVTEREYAVQTNNGIWTLIGDDLDAAAVTAQTVRATANLGDRSAEIVRYIAKHPDGVRAGEVAEAMRMPVDEAGVYLRRLLDADRLRRPERGLYTPVLSVLSVLSEGDGLAEKNTKNTKNSTVGCTVCGFPLDAVLVASGEATHPGCED